MPRKPKRFNCLEKDVLKSVEHAMYSDANVFIHRVNTGAFKTEDRFIRCGTPGQSDFSGIVKEIRCPVCRVLLGKGVRLEIECKAPNGTVSPKQAEWIDMINAMGGIAFVIQPKAQEELFPVNIKKEINRNIYQPCSRCQRGEN